MGGRKDAQLAEDALDAAALRLQSQLSTTQSLAQTDALRMRVASEKATKDAQLKTAVRNHLDNATTVTALVGQAQALLLSVATNLSSITALSSQSQSLVQDYSSLRGLAAMHDRLASARDLARALGTVDERVAEIVALMDADAKNFMNARYLLYVFAVLSDLEELRERMLRDARRLSPEVVASLRARFVGVWEASAQFEALLLLLAGKLLVLARTNPAVIVAMMRIVETSEEQDARALRAEEDSGGTGFTRGFRAKVQERIIGSISEAFEGRLAAFSEDLDGALNAITMLIDELTFVFDDVVPLFPPSFALFALFVRTYHAHTAAALDAFAARGLDPRQLLQVFHFCESYRADLVGRLGASESWLQPPLLGAGTADALLDEFRRVVKSRVDAWCTAIVAGERRAFASRPRPPEVDKDGLFVSATPIDLFGLANQQVDMAAMSRSPPLIKSVIGIIAALMRDYQAAHVAMIDAELRKAIGDADADAAMAAMLPADIRGESTQESAPESTRDLQEAGDAADGVGDGVGGAASSAPAEFFLEYLIMEVNLHAKCADFVVEMADHVKVMLRAHWDAATESMLHEMEAGFRAVIRRATAAIVALMTSDVTMALDVAFTARWYDADPVRDIVATFEDYAADLRRRLAEYHFTKLVYELLDRTVILYCNGMLAKGAVFRPSAAERRIDQDVGTMSAFFAQHLIEKRVAKAMQAVLDLKGLAAGDAAALVQHCTLLKHAYPDITAAFIGRVLEKRADLNKEKITAMLEKAASVLASQPPRGMPPTVIARLPRFAAK